jgi:hypothetical protein
MLGVEGKLKGQFNGLCNGPIAPALIAEMVLADNCKFCQPRISIQKQKLRNRIP